MDLTPGMMVTSNVRLVRLLGQGGMGGVWVADHLSLDTQVAVKFIAPEWLAAGGPGVLERFQREAKAAAKIKSPHVVHTYDYGVMDGGVPYIVMELLDGQSLGERLAASGALALTDAVEILGQAAKALHEAHQLGIVHRDIKPDNIFLQTATDELFIKVLDFGIAKQAHQPGEQALTGTHSMLGTPLYMSPEQLLTPKEVDYRSDLWSLAVVTFHMLTGKVPFAGETLASLSISICSQPHPAPHELRAGLHPELSAWFDRALCKDPQGRFGSGKELAVSFEQACSQVIQRSGPGVMLAQIPATTHESSTGPSPAAAIGGPQASPMTPMPGVTPMPGQTQLPGVAAQPAPATFGGAAATAPTQGGAAGSPAKWVAAGLGVAALAAVAIVAVMMVGRAADETKVVEPAVEPVPTTPTTTASAADSAPAHGPAPDGMVAVAAGRYSVGCDDELNRRCFPDERPLHEIELEAFAIMRHEVSMEEYDLCVADGVCPPAGKEEGCSWQQAGKEKRPINCVSWTAAVSFCTHRGWRLPTEMEWEVAARGTKRLDYPWGNQRPSCERAAVAKAGKPGCGTGEALDVGSRPGDRSWVGAMDMAGNVREWTASDYAAYPGGKPDPSRRGKVNRGGSYLMTGDQLNASHTRGVDSPGAARPGLGFRCAEDL